MNHITAQYILKHTIVGLLGTNVVIALMTHSVPPAVGPFLLALLMVIPFALLSAMLEEDFL